MPGAPERPTVRIIVLLNRVLAADRIDVADVDGVLAVRLPRTE